MFGYLSIATLTFTLLSAFVVPLGVADFHLLHSLPYADRLDSAATRMVVRDSCVVIFALALAHISSTTALGVYYIVDRMHYRAPRVLTRKPERSEAA